VGDAVLRNEFAESCMQLWVPPANSSFGLPEEEEQVEAINDLQNKLMTYRLANYAAVKAGKFDVPEFDSATREYARSMGRCLVGAPLLLSRLKSLLKMRDEAERTESASLLDAVVLEAMTVCCHERKRSVHVSEVTAIANAILSRHEEQIALSAKQVGGRMKRIGFRTRRLDSGGRGIHLLNSECARIHDLGRALGIATLRQGLAGCPHCRKK